MYGGKKMAKIVISTTIDAELWRKAKNYNIMWSEALRVGIGVILSERGDSSYNGQVNVLRKIRAFQERLQEMSKSVEDIQK